jgi:hypothetical protein
LVQWAGAVTRGARGYDQATSDVETLLKAGEFPFRCEFSLPELARYWGREGQAGHPLAAIIGERLAGAPELPAGVPGAASAPCAWASTSPIRGSSDQSAPATSRRDSRRGDRNALKEEGQMRYVDGFVLAVPRKNLPAYRRMAGKAGKVWRHHGALDFKECVGDDLKVKMGIPFPRLAKTAQRNGGFLVHCLRRAALGSRQRKV